MTKQEHLLTLLMEECAETAQRASKAIRFTMDEIQPGQILTNGARIVYEFNDILAVMELLQDSGAIGNVIDRKAIDLKKEKVREYMRYSRDLGTID